MQQEETPTTEEGIPGGESSLEEGTIPEEVIPEGESTPEKEDLPEEGSVPEKEEVPEEEVSRKKKSSRGRSIPEKETDPKRKIFQKQLHQKQKNHLSSRKRKRRYRASGDCAGFDIDFYIIIGGEKVNFRTMELPALPHGRMDERHIMEFL